MLQEFRRDDTSGIDLNEVIELSDHELEPPLILSTSTTAPPVLDQHTQSPSSEEVDEDIQADKSQ